MPKQIIKKRNKSFVRHEGDRYLRLQKTSYRRPKGIDNRMRRRWRGSRPLPKAGYGSAKATRHLLPNGLYKFVVHNATELDMLLMHNDKYAAQVAHSVSSKKRKEIIERAQQLNVKVLNLHARVRSTEGQ